MMMMIRLTLRGYGGDDMVLLLLAVVVFRRRYFTVNSPAAVAAVFRKNFRVEIPLFRWFCCCGGFHEHNLVGRSVGSPRWWHNISSAA